MVTQREGEREQRDEVTCRGIVVQPSGDDRVFRDPSKFHGGNLSSGTLVIGRRRRRALGVCATSWARHGRGLLTRGPRARVRRVNWQAWRLLSSLHLRTTTCPRRGPVSGAARELGVSRSAVSQSVRQLEKELRVTLVARTTRSVSLTDAGRRLLESAGPAVAQVRAALVDVSAKPDEVVDVLQEQSALSSGGATFEFGHAVLGNQLSRERPMAGSARAAGSRGWARHVVADSESQAA
jgi:DNA-binding MarR family transcriptional regulator